MNEVINNSLANLNDLSQTSTAFAFRGYNTTNLGRSYELLHHPEYSHIFKKYLTQASKIAEESLMRRVDLLKRVEEQKELPLGAYPETIALIMAVSLAQIEALQQIHGVDYSKAKVVFGYSLGELVALVTTKVYAMESTLELILPLARDAAELALDVKLGVVFCRGRQLDYSAVERHCLEVSNEGKGTIGISGYLSPNTVILLGQGDTIDHFKNTICNIPPHNVQLKKDNHLWPPLHTQIVCQKNLSDRAAVALETMPGGFSAPQPPILSCVTGDIAYTDVNSRELIKQWVEQPQHLWSVIEKTMQMGIDRIVHVGPEPNIIPRTMNRLAIDISAQLNRPSLTGISMKAVSHITRKRPWLAQLISKNAALLRAPFVEHIILEDWLLEKRPVK
ncbi:MAG: ACP S-malonyltransferase [SAR86 cluster bacterium]|uniref:[acyl-carrier-protein] S-malonyltransferase n=1 Tax=SAR86 cluster bacterium TaxID=2030880 RepID=A0A2A5C5X9_9GAMM|nr:MAG: ACP S-malonyltransferase [SAR86 cluster bacterium]